MQKRSPYGRSAMLIKKDLIREAGRKCQGCGQPFPERLKTTELAMRDSYCKVDYKVPLKRGGKVELQNVQVLCPPCYDGKTHADLTDAEWRARGCPQGGVKIPVSHTSAHRRL